MRELNKNTVDVFRLYKLFKDKNANPKVLMNRYLSIDDKKSIQSFETYKKIYADEDVKEFFPNIYEAYDKVTKRAIKSILIDINLAEEQKRYYFDKWLKLRLIYKDIYRNTNKNILYDIETTTNGKIKIHKESIVNPLLLGHNNFSKWIAEMYREVSYFDVSAFESTVAFNIMDIAFEGELYAYLANILGVEREDIKKNIFSWMWGGSRNNKIISELDNKYGDRLKTLQNNFSTIKSFQHYIAGESAATMGDIIINFNEKVAGNGHVVGIIYDAVYFLSAIDVFDYKYKNLYLKFNKILDK